MVSEVREIIRRALLVALGVLLAIPAVWSLLLLGSFGLWVAGGSFAVFLLGWVLINWIFLKW